MKKHQPKTNKKNVIDDGLNPVIFDSKEVIEWLMSIPKIEWSDSMIEVYEKLDSQSKNEPAAIRFFFESNLKKEIDEFIDWNNNIV